LGIVDEKLFKRFPYSGRFKSVVSDRGFAFIEYETNNGREEIFAHTTCEYGASNSISGGVITGKECFFAIGPRSHNDQRPTAISWSLAENIATDQEFHSPKEYSKKRASFFKDANIASLKSWLEASWLKESENHILLKDPLFEPRDADTPLGIEIIIKAVRGLPMGSQSMSDFGRVLEKNSYDLGVYSGWLAEDLIQSENKLYLLNQPPDELLEVFSPVQLAKILPPPPTADVLVDPRFHESLFEWCILCGEKSRELRKKIGTDELWLSAIENLAIGIDIEADNESIKQLGSYQNQQCQIWFDEYKDPNGIGISESVKYLTKTASNFSILVGHNFIHWDLPKLAEFQPALSKIPVWDTLLVKALLDPAANTMALMSTHNAGDDAKAAIQLFIKQVKQLGATIVGEFLTDGGSTSHKILEFIVPLAEKVSVTPTRPAWLEEILQNDDFDRHTQNFAMNNSQIKELAWQRDIYISSDSKSIPDADLNPVDLDAIIETIQNKSHSSPFLSVLEGMARIALTRNINIRRTDLPFWLTEKKEIEQIINGCKFGKEISNDPLRILPFPKKVDWYTPDHINATVFINPPKNTIHLRERISPSSNSLSDPVIDLLTDPKLSKRRFVRIPSENSTKFGHWISFDKPYDFLESDDSSFTIESFIPTNNVNTYLMRDENTPRFRFYDSESVHLFPGSNDEKNYWTEVVEKSVLYCQETELFDVVPILFVTSSGSSKLIELLRDAFAAVDRAPQKLPHQSRLRWLQLAQGFKAPCLVDHINALDEWLSISQSSNIKIFPIIEALPLEIWLASLLASNKISKDELPDKSSHNDLELAGEDVSKRLPKSSVTKEHLEITDKEILRLLPQALEGELASWVAEVGLKSVDDALIMDPRLSVRATMSYRFFDGIRVPGAVQPDQSEKISVALENLSIDSAGIPDISYDVYRQFLKIHWGYDDFIQETQAPAIDAIRTRDADVLITLPTGAGKSIVFQVPALYRGLISRKLSIVISPLRQLMRDQVENLWERGFGQSVEYLTAERPWHEIEEVYQGILDHRVTLLYVAPERFRNKKFLSAITRRSHRDNGFEFIIIDEAHCVNQWGYEFRPDYIYAVELIAKLYRESEGQNPPPFIMLSATVTAPTKLNLERITKGSSDTGRPFEFKIRPEGYWHPIRKHISPTPQHVLGSISRRDPEEWDLDNRMEAITEVVRTAKEQNLKSGQHGSIVIFVNRRSHAEEVAAQITRSKIASADFFHAGLDAEEKQDRFERFKAGATDVLVATKAFGMGIDIPHIFWAIHLSPPGFLEDYLQEIGRIGRGEEERKNAGLDKLDARLLYSNEDFETNHSNIQRGQVGFPEIYDFWEQLISNSKSVQDDKFHIAVVPEEGFVPAENVSARRAEASKVRKFLFWLERLERLELIATLPSLIEVKVNKVVLKSVGNDAGPASEIISSILGLIGEVNPTFSPSNPNRPTNITSDKPALNSMFSLLSDIIGSVAGFVLGSKKARSSPVLEDDGSIEPGPHSADLNSHNILLDLAYLYKSTSLESVDAVLESISELVKFGGLEVRRNLNFTKYLYGDLGAEAISALFQCVENATVELISACEGKRNFDLDELIAVEIPSNFSLNGLLLDPVDLASVLRRAAIRSAQSSGVKIQKLITDDGLVRETASLANNKGRLCKARAKETIRLAKSIWEVIAEPKDDEDSSVQLSSLLERCTAINQHVRISNVNKALRVISWMRLASTSDQLLPMSYVVGLKKVDVNLEEKENPSVLSELADVNRMSELRGQAMEIYTHLPSQEARDEFIELYFEKQTTDEIEKLLLDQIRLVDDVDGGGWVAKKLSEIRAEEITKHFDRYKRENAAEPNQWVAISHPFNRPLLINAGPGSGKTGVLVARLVHLIYEQKVPPGRIIVLAFNRAVVFEIRSRVRSVFTSLGYGAYVSRLRISTFHSLAMRHTKGTMGAEGLDANAIGPDSAIGKFAAQLRSQPNFAKEVVGDAQVIMVDEFQDINDDRFDILTNMAKVSGASVTAVGDDDQDIYAWDRSPRKSSVEYFKKFTEKFGPDCPSINLSVNFRSVEGIVNISQTVINYTIRNDRIKENITLKPTIDAGQGIVEKIETDQDVRQKVIDQAKDWLKISQEENSSLAILCRTNNEVAAVHRELSRDYPNLRIPSRANFLFKDNRHAGGWLECVYEAADGPNTILDKNLKSRVSELWNNSRILEARSAESHPVDIWKIWEICFEEKRYPRLRDLDHLLQRARNEDIDQLVEWHAEKNIGGSARTSPLIVSTIHKVKGLEFEKVVIIPSNAYATNLQSGEEARLFYVAMTRAKHGLLYALGRREQRWAGKNVITSGTDLELINASSRKVLFPGTNRENSQNHTQNNEYSYLDIGYSGADYRIQKYIEESVAFGDKLTLRDREIYHNSNKIGRFKQDRNLSSNYGEFYVAGVERYPVKEKYFSRYCTTVQKRGWFYFVVIEGWIEV